MAEPISADSSVKNLMTSLFKMVMTGDWGSIVNHYYEDWSCHTQKITRSGDTALHVAVADGLEDTVKNLLEAISSRVGAEKLKTILRMKNVEGNTPLHIAASMGSAAMCEEIAKHDLSLVGVKNSAGETPLFLAAQQGHKDAFLCLTEICGCQAGYQYCTRVSDGQTVLHSAISEQYFGE
ncbi:hypothetical protein TIFTF001_043065 [Ficus carica]|uniref:Uncharacterized protein n=1 Tax=Ficus carica TaxID=3494 RepID=A0AA87YQD4_FICCA|nr:hypothetical protein TIFTF001_043065 [Ficus carica]